VKGTGCGVLGAWCGVKGSLNLIYTLLCLNKTTLVERITQMQIARRKMWLEVMADIRAKRVVILLIGYEFIPVKKS